MERGGRSWVGPVSATTRSKLRSDLGTTMIRARQVVARATTLVALARDLTRIVPDQGSCYVDPEISMLNLSQSDAPTPGRLDAWTAWTERSLDPIMQERGPGVRDDMVPLALNPTTDSPRTRHPPDGTRPVHLSVRDQRLLHQQSRCSMGSTM